MSEFDDLNEKMDSEQIKAYADSIAEEVAAERQGEDKSDAEIVVSNSAPAKETKAEKKSGEKSAEVSSESDDSGEDVSLPKWVDEKVKAEVAAYGIKDSELSEFSSRDELDKVLRFLDKKTLEVGRKAMTDGEEKPTRNEKGQFVSKQETESEDDQANVDRSNDRYEVSLSKDLYDDEIVDEFARLRDHYESRLERLESYFAEVSARSEEERFDNYVDSLGFTELFGKTGSESEQELERRRDLHVAVKAQIIGLERLGRPAELTDQLVSRVANMVFADEIGKKRLKQQTQKISRQSQMRLGGSPTKPQPPREDPREEADRLYKELERA